LVHPVDTVGCGMMEILYVKLCLGLSCVLHGNGRDVINLEQLDVGAVLWQVLRGMQAQDIGALSGVGCPSGELAVGWLVDVKCWCSCARLLTL